LRESMLHVKFFASVRERVGRSQMDLPWSEGMTVTAALQAVEEASGVTLHGQHLLAARNQHHVTFAEPLADGDEVAFFPPVTGG
jgi:molybdopterin synthase sulfur carrier subunit